MFYDRLIVLCEQKGVSPSRVLAELNISVGNLKRWRDGAEPSKIVQSAQGWLQKEAGVKPEQIEAADNSINNKYKEILKIEVSGTEAEKIQQLFFELYKDYSSMHHNVTTATLTMSDFSNETLDTMNSFSKNNEQLKTLLK